MTWRRFRCIGRNGGKGVLVWNESISSLSLAYIHSSYPLRPFTYPSYPLRPFTYPSYPLRLFIHPFIPSVHSPTHFIPSVYLSIHLSIHSSPPSIHLPILSPLSIYPFIPSVHSLKDFLISFISLKRCAIKSLRLSRNIVAFIIDNNSLNTAFCFQFQAAV